MLQIVGIAASDLFHTLHYNLQRDPHQQSRLQLMVDYRHVPTDCIANFKAFSDEQSLAMLKRLDAWLSECVGQKQAQNDTQRVGVGLYFFNNDVEAVCGEYSGEQHD